MAVNSSQWFKSYGQSSFAKTKQQHTHTLFNFSSIGIVITKQSLEQSCDRPISSSYSRFCPRFFPFFCHIFSFLSFNMRRFPSPGLLAKSVETLVKDKLNPMVSTLKGAKDMHQLKNKCIYDPHFVARVSCNLTMDIEGENCSIHYFFLL